MKKVCFLTCNGVQRKKGNAEIEKYRHDHGDFPVKTHPRGSAKRSSFLIVIVGKEIVRGNFGGSLVRKNLATGKFQTAFLFYTQSTCSRTLPWKKGKLPSAVFPSSRGRKGMATRRLTFRTVMRCSTPLSKLLMRRFLSYDGQPEVGTFCILGQRFCPNFWANRVKTLVTMEPFFRGHPQDQRKCPLNRGIP